MRIIVFTGSGGSGVSTIAAATAAALATGGQRTLAFGITRGLGRALNAALTLEAGPVSERLDAVEGHSGHGGPDEFRDWLESLLDFRSMEIDLADDLTALPGVNHLGRLLKLEQLAESGAYDAIVIDAADLSQFLDLPAALDAAARWLDRLFAPRQQTVFETFLRPFAQEYASAGDEVFATGRALLTRLADFRDVLADPETTSVRVVVRPERGALDDLREAVTVLSLFGYRVDAAILNRLLPDAVADPFFGPAKAEQKRLLDEAESIGLSQRVLTSHLEPDPPAGPGALAERAAALYAGAAPGDFFSEPPSHTLERGDGQYVLNVALPYAKRETLRLEEMDEGIAVHLNGRRCVVTLPEDVVYSQASSWTYEAGFLRVVLAR